MTLAPSNTLVVMGVCGVGKTTVAQLVSKRTSSSFLDADDFHSEESVSAMREGRPLTDAMRIPWLHRVAAGAQAAHQAQPEKPIVAACSALKRSYRDILRAHMPDTLFIYLSADEHEIRQRMAERSDHFMPVAMLEGQLAILEPPERDERHIKIDASVNVDAIVAQILTEIERLGVCA
ncbi:MAG: gluconokinase [Pseudomonadota bacterium]